jgi:hypothetical protein
MQRRQERLTQGATPATVLAERSSSSSRRARAMSSSLEVLLAEPCAILCEIMVSQFENFRASAEEMRVYP